MLKDKLEALGSTRASRRTVLKGLLVGLGAGVLVQATGGVTTYARTEQEKGTDQKIEKKKEGEGGKKLEKKKSDSKSKSEKKKAEEPKNQHKK